MAARRVARQLGLPNRYVVGDARFLPFRDEAFGVVFSYSVLQHLSKEDARAAVAEAGRVLRPGGQSLIQMPNWLGVRCLYHQVRRGFREPRGFEVRYWGVRELKQAFEQAVGPSTLSVDCYFGLGLQKTDRHLMSPKLRLAIDTSERLRALSRRVDANEVRRRQPVHPFLQAESGLIPGTPWSAGSGVRSAHHHNPPGMTAPLGRCAGGEGQVACPAGRRGYCRGGDEPGVCVTFRLTTSPVRWATPSSPSIPPSRLTHPPAAPPRRRFFSGSTARTSPRTASGSTPAVSCGSSSTACSSAPRHAARTVGVRCCCGGSARIGKPLFIRPTCRVMHPWLLETGDWVQLGDDVVVYNLGPIRIGRHTTVSQGTYLCAGSHDYTQPDLPLTRPPVTLGSGVWVAAQAFIGPGVTVGDNSVVGARAVVTRDVPPGVVVAGNPGRVIKPRRIGSAT